MKTTRVLTWLSVVTITGALMMPALASAHGRHERWGHYDGARWSAPHWKRAKSPYRHHYWRDHSRGRGDWSRRPIHRDPVIRYHLGNGLTIIYR